MEQSLQPKFYCVDCDYKCIYPAHWKQHLESDKHDNGGKRKPRCDKILEPKCDLCSFTTNNLTNMKVHKLTKHSSKEEQKIGFKYYCDKCEFGTFGDILFTRHLETKKHINK
jgi:hypothetical protein